MDQQHKIRWYVWTGGHGLGRELIPQTSTMRGHWPGYDAKCSCGWSTRTGGATRGYIKREIRDHKLDVELGFWKESA